MARIGRAAAALRGAVSMAARGAAIATHLQRVSPHRFRHLIGRVELAAYCLRDVTSGAYRRVPWKTVAALTAALAYFISPFDALPDFVPLTGFVDDAAVLALVFGAAESDLRRYCTWRGLDARRYFAGV